MTKQSVIDMDGIGPVLFRKNRRAKHLRITVRPFYGVRVTVPRGVDFDLAEETVTSRAAWIRKHMRKIRELEEAQKEAANVLPPIDREEARRVLSSRLNTLAAEHGFTYNRLFIRDQKTRWGSCSAQKNINLNMKLLRLPDELIDFIILHELIHTRVMNHGKSFWAELLKVSPDARQLSKRMKEYRLALV